MMGVRRVLGGKAESATELETMMENLDAYAAEWARSSIYHTDDVSGAILKAVTAGFDYTETIHAIPAAMHIAQAGSMDLTTALDTLATIMRATGSEYSDLQMIVDQWAMASDSAKTNASELGEAFVSLGATSQFAGSTQELFTLLAVLADVGTTGSEAGTALRGAMMRIIALTTKAEDAMSLLGADADELSEALSDESVTKAAKTLEGLGFSAYDAQGNLLPMIDIFTNMYTALQGLKEDAQNEIITAIFPTRTTAAAKAFLDAIGSGHMAELFTAIGDSEGYAAKGANIMMSGLTGAIETLSSKWENFQLQIGKTLAPAIENMAGGLGEILDAMNNMDESTLAGLVTALTGIAAAGPGLLIAGGAMKTFATLGPAGTALVAVGIGAAFAVGKLTALSEINFRDNEGTPRGLV